MSKPQLKTDWKEVLLTLFAGTSLGYMGISSFLFAILGIAHIFSDNVPFPLGLGLAPIGIGLLVGIRWVLEDWKRFKVRSEAPDAD